MNKIAQNLKSNFLFQASLGSKELFHSNMLAWLLKQKNEKGQFEALRIFIKQIADHDLSESINEEDIQIAREEENIDLTIKWKEDDKWKLIFIENKIKSLPTIKQLEKYNQKINKLKGARTKTRLERTSIKELFLTPLASGLDLNAKKEIINWENITYSEHIIQFMNKIEGLNFENKDVPFVIANYIKFLKNLIDLLIQFNFDKEDVTFLQNTRYNLYSEGLDKKEDEITIDQLRNLRLHDLVLKLAHEKIGRLIRKKLKGNYQVVDEHPSKEFKSGNIYITNGFSRSTGITDIKICLDAQQIIGLQLQGNTLKYLTEVFGDKKLHEQNKRFAFKLLKSKLWFYDAKNNKILSGKGRNKKDLTISNSNMVFNSYGLNFIYLNMDVSTYAEKPISNLIDFVVDEIKRVIDNIDDFKKHIPK